MKKKFFALMVFSVGFLCYSQRLDNSEISVYNELTAEWASGYYPGVVEKASLLEANYPESVFIIPSKILKAESQLHLGQFPAAEKTLNSVLPSLRSGSEDFTKSYCLLGHSLFNQKKYALAAEAFYNSIQAAKTDGNYEFYPQSVLYLARSRYFCEDYDNALPYYESVIQNGKDYTVFDYETSLSQLFVCYDALKKYDSLIFLYERLPADKLSKTVYSSLTLYAADAYEHLGKNNSSYDLYSSLSGLDGGFWVGFGIEFYEKGDFARARSCFAFAKDDVTPEQSLAMSIYKAKMMIEESLDPQKVAPDAISELEPLYNTAEKSKTDGMKDSYFAILSYCEFLLEHYEQARDYYKEISVPDSPAKYVGGAAFYKTGDLPSAEKTLSSVTDEQGRLLYASVLAKEGKFTQAENIYKNYDTTLNSKNRLEYAKVLYLQKKYHPALTQVQKTEEPHSPYIEGICQIQTSRWQPAFEAFDAYLKNYNDSYGFFDDASYYRAYSAYRNSQYQTAYSLAAEYGDKSRSKEFKYKAYNLAARSAAMLGDFSGGAVQAEKLIKAAYDLESEHSAVLLCSEIYTDGKNYDAAIRKISPYTTENTDFAVTALNQTALIYEKKGDLASASAAYSRIHTEYKGSDNAERALYRNAEIFYSNEKYGQAEENFTKYLYEYPSGAYTDSAYYFSGDSNFRLKNYERCIMQLKNLIVKYPDSVYTYGAYKTMLDAYYENEHYSDALSSAKFLLQNYNSQATSDGITSRVVDIEKIMSGTDRHIVEKESEYERLGKSYTPSGRKSGSELVKLYSSYGSLQAAYKLAQELLEMEVSAQEFDLAADNAFFIAEYMGVSGKKRDAADYYLKAAEYYRAANIPGQSARCLYSATDAFAAAGFLGDAQETAALLIQLYPNTDYASRVDRLLK